MNQTTRDRLTALAVRYSPGGIAPTRLMAEQTQLTYKYLFDDGRWYTTFGHVVGWCMTEQNQILKFTVQPWILMNDVPVEYQWEQVRAEDCWLGTCPQILEGG